MNNPQQTLKNVKVGGDLIIAGGDIVRGLQSARVDLTAALAKSRERLTDQVVFPWFSESETYRVLFPKLFQKPNLLGRTVEGTYDILQRYREQNIAILGEAGAGKTTLLLYRFLFDKAKSSGWDCLYLTVKEALLQTEQITYVEKLCQAVHVGSIQKLTIMIDGIDEEFLNDYKGYLNFLTLLKRLQSCYPCSFWLGCRKDLFDQYRGEASRFVSEEFVIEPWTDKQALDYIAHYALITACPELQENINRLTERETVRNEFFKNPFQLSLLAYIAQQGTRDGVPVTTVYELYCEFFEVWFRREIQRGTTENTVQKVLYPRLLEIARGLYENLVVEAEDQDSENSAIRNLVQINRSSYRGSIITAMYHRSMVSFLMAQLVVKSMLDSDKTNELAALFAMQMRDDVTNFIGSRFTTMTPKDKQTAKHNLMRVYRDMKRSPEEQQTFIVMEKCIYHLTRMNPGAFDADVTDFLLQEISPEPTIPHMRLTLAYGCALSDCEAVRAFALQYAKSIAQETQDAVVNRSWTVVYFGDVAENLYTFEDNNQYPWTKARAARIRRFTKKNPRLKDLRFLMFDLPLMHSFLKNRGWNDISTQEYDIIANLSFSPDVFSSAERDFLYQAQQALLKDYRTHLSD